MFCILSIVSPRVALGSEFQTYETAGNDSDQALLLLAPLGRDRGSWGAQLPFFAERYFCITPDTRGTGGSTDVLTGFAIGQFAQDAIALLNHLGVRQAHVAGWSMGSGVAMALAVRAPDRVRSLSLYTPWARTDAPLRERFLEMRRLAQEDDTLVSVEEHTLRMILSDSALAGIPDLRAAAEEATKTPGYPTAEALIGHIDASIAHDVLADLPSLRCPTLVIGGASDALTPAYLARQVSEAIPRAEYTELDGPLSSHALPLEMADGFNSIARDFLDQH